MHWVIYFFLSCIKILTSSCVTHTCLRLLVCAVAFSFISLFAKFCHKKTLVLHLVLWILLCVCHVMLKNNFLPLYRTTVGFLFFSLSQIIFFLQPHYLKHYGVFLYVEKRVCRKQSGCIPAWMQSLSMSQWLGSAQGLYLTWFEQKHLYSSFILVHIVGQMLWYLWLFHGHHFVVLSIGTCCLKHMRAMQSVANFIAISPIFKR